MRRIFFAGAAACALLAIAFWASGRFNLNLSRAVGEQVDVFNGVPVFFNGAVDHTEGRTLSADGYNIGLKYQCVEFVKRYYFEHLGHRMPDSYGHAKDFFDPKIADGTLSPKRGLMQFINPSASAPRVDDILVYGPTLMNEFGHVAIVSAVTETEIEVVQQNPGPFGKSRERFALTHEGGRWRVRNGEVMGWQGRRGVAKPVVRACCILECLWPSPSMG
jgi:hypothetical protein